MDKLLSFYVKRFQKLRRDYKNGGAPHKPVLLLSIIELISERNITSNKIYITPRLVAKFKDIWNQHVNTNHKPTFALPFFHMRSEGFWFLITKPGFEFTITKSKSISSFKSLKEALDYAELDANLFNILLIKENREILKAAIIEAYFPNTILNYPNSYTDYFSEIEKEILYDDPDYIKNKLAELKAILPSDEFEEEKFIRKGAFREEVIKIYNSTCSVSRFRIDSTENISLIDACHIKPFSLSNDNHITNGIALCPNLHRAFDRGLISLDENFNIIVSSQFSEYSNNPFSIKQFANTQILLPINEKFYPAYENLKFHRDNVFIS